MGIGDWGLGIGGLGCGARPQHPQTTTQTPPPQKKKFLKKI